MLSKPIEEALNGQLHHELSSAYVYLSMSAYFGVINLSGFARWMRVQSREEVSHAMRFFDFIGDRGGRVMLRAVDQPSIEFQSPLDVFQRSLEHEQEVTAAIQRLYGLAAKEHDYATQAFLQWFLTEQVEEEKTANGIVAQLKMIGTERTALFMLDKELGSRQGDQ